VRRHVYERTATAGPRVLTPSALIGGYQHESCALMHTILPSFRRR